MPLVYCNNVTTTIYAQNLEKGKRKKENKLKRSHALYSGDCGILHNCILTCFYNEDVYSSPLNLCYLTCTQVATYGKYRIYSLTVRWEAQIVNSISSH